MSRWKLYKTQFRETPHAPNRASTRNETVCICTVRHIIPIFCEHSKVMKRAASLLTFSLVALSVQAEQTQTCERTKVAVL